MKRPPVILVLCLAVAGCAPPAPTPGGALSLARAAYTDARSRAHTPDDLANVFEARMALDRAEAVHDDAPASAAARDASYVALRKTQAALVGSVTNAANERAAALENFEARATPGPGDIDENGASAGETPSRASAEVGRSLHDADARRELGDVGEVWTRGREVTVGFATSQLFDGARAKLSRDGRARLDQVADVLCEARGRSVTVVVAIDARAMTRQEERDQDRADAVASYLTTKGLNPDVVGSRTERRTDVGRRSVRIEVDTGPP